MPDTVVAPVSEKERAAQVAGSGRVVNDMVATGSIRGGSMAHKSGFSVLAGRTLRVGNAADLNLKSGEVILTFDDGPSPARTPAILDALDAHSVKATFFMVGKMAAAHPEIAQMVAKRGHTIGTHTHNHENLAKLTFASALDKVDSGEVEIQQALAPVHGKVAPFFRFPYLAQTRLLRTSLVEQGLVVFDVDVDSLDFKKDSSEVVMARTLRRLDAAGKGIILFHDIHARTARLMPDFLRALKERGYKVVHAVPRGTGLFDRPLVTAERPSTVDWAALFN